MCDFTVRNHQLQLCDGIKMIMLNHGNNIETSICNYSDEPFLAKQGLSPYGRRVDEQVQFDEQTYSMSFREMRLRQMRDIP